MRGFHHYYYQGNTAMRSASNPADVFPPVAARFVTTARFATKVTKRAAMPARFVTNEVVTNRAGIAPFFSLGYQYM